MNYKLLLFNTVTSQQGERNDQNYETLNLEKDILFSRKLCIGKYIETL